MPRKKKEEIVTEEKSSTEIKTRSTRTKKGTIRKKPGPKAKPGPKGLNREKILEKLKRYLQLDLSIERACNAFNADEYERSVINKKKPEFISAQTVREWARNDEEFRGKIEFYQDTPNVLARQVWREKIAKGDYQASKDWLERREKAEFSLKTNETTLNTQVEVKIENKKISERFQQLIQGNATNES